MKQKKIDKYAEHLRNNLPKSEKWFWSEYKKTDLYDENDFSNLRYKRYIPDVINFKCKFIIEIDGSIHNDKNIQKKDDKKTKFFNSHGFLVLRITAYDKEELLSVFKILRIIKNKCAVKTILRNINH